MSENGAAPIDDWQIMLVDDDVSLSRCYEIGFTKMGYKATAYTSPLEAFEAFKQRPDAFACVITDLCMPKMTGLELSRRILDIKPSIPIIMISGNQTREQEEEARQTGVLHFLQKPVHLPSLSKLIDAIIENTEKEIKQAFETYKISILTESNRKISIRNELENPVDDDFLSEILPHFFKDRGKEAEQLIAALKEKDYQGIHDIGHRIKGSARSFGYTKYETLGAALQKAAKDQDNEAIEAGIDALLNFLIEDNSKL